MARFPALLATLLLVLTAVVPAQEKESVTLRWKVPDGKAIGFKTSLQQVDPANAAALRIDMDKMSEMLRDASSELGAPIPKDLKLPPEKMKEFFESLKLPKEYSMTSVLKKLPKGTISYLLIPDKGIAPTGGPAEMQELLKKMSGTVQLRAEMTERRATASFCLQPTQ